jgi:hypothetical protein
MKKFLTLLCLVPLVLGVSQLSLAHGVTKPQHGGIVQSSGEAFFELVQETGGVALYVLNEDEPVDAKAMTAKLNISAEGKKTEVAMVATQGHRFFAQGLKLGKGSTVAVMVIDQATKSRLGTTFTVP